MVLKRSVITERLKELDRVLQELHQYRRDSEEQMHSNLSQRWIIERGLIAAASLILDIASHILASHFGDYRQTYESNLVGLVEHGVISSGLYHELKGLGGFRNILVHLYQNIDPHQVWESYQKSLIIFPQFAQEVIAWLDEEE